MTKLNRCYLGVVVGLAFAACAFADRMAPKDVAPLTQGEVKYCAPHDHMGCVEARDVATGHLIWRRQVYVVRYVPGWETDVQDCFITKIEAKGGKLLVSNEKTYLYELDPVSLEVKVLKGQLVVGEKRE